jgi:hypothetical protein
MTVYRLEKRHLLHPVRLFGTSGKVFYPAAEVRAIAKGKGAVETNG